MRYFKYLYAAATPLIVTFVSNSNSAYNPEKWLHKPL